MSRIGKKPIILPEGVTVGIAGNQAKIKGPKGELSLGIHQDIKATVNGNQVTVEKNTESKVSRSAHGLVRALLANAVIGVTEGWNKTLKLVGTGYRGEPDGESLVLSLGFSHPVKVKSEPGIKFTVEGNDTIVISGIDKNRVGQVAAKIRQIRPPEPYKGKGIKYSDEVVRRKAGKAAKVGAAGFGTAAS